MTKFLLAFTLIFTAQFTQAQSSAYSGMSEMELVKAAFANDRYLTSAIRELPTSQQSEYCSIINAVKMYCQDGVEIYTTLLKKYSSSMSPSLVASSNLEIERYQRGIAVYSRDPKCAKK